METTTPENQRIRPCTEAPGAPTRRRRPIFEEYIHVEFAEIKIYISGHTEYTRGRRVFQRRPDVRGGDDLSAMSLEYLNYDLLHDLDNSGHAIRASKYDDEAMTFHQLVLIKIT